MTTHCSALDLPGPAALSQENSFKSCRVGEAAPVPRPPPMTPPTAMPPSSASHYRLPELLQDIRLLDLLELCGSTVQTGQLMNLSQPTVSRRYRSLAADFGLARKRRSGDGCAYGTSACIQLLRLGCRAHRLAAGVARLGSDMLHHPLLADNPWLLPTPPRFRAATNWLEMVRQGVLDGALISGLELEGGIRTIGRP